MTINRINVIKYIEEQGEQIKEIIESGGGGGDLPNDFTSSDYVIKGDGDFTNQIVSLEVYRIGGTITRDSIVSNNITFCLTFPKTMYGNTNTISLTGKQDGYESFGADFVNNAYVTISKTQLNVADELYIKYNIVNANGPQIIEKLLCTLA